MKRFTHWSSGIVVLMLVGLLLAWQGADVNMIQAQSDTWTTELARKLGVELLESFDSSGEPAWDPIAHPDVFITTEGPGYGGLLSGVTLPGVAIFDSNTREVVASASFDLGWSDVFEPHGLGVSSDGQWIYLPTGEGRSNGRLLIINALTLKVDKVLATMGRPHHAKAFTNAEGKDLSLAYGWGQPAFVMDPANDNRVVGGIDFNEMGMEGYLYFVEPNGEFMWAGGRLPSALRAETHFSVMIKINTSDWTVEEYVPIEDSTPVWASFSADGEYAYFSGGHSSKVFKYNLKSAEMETFARAGVEGPYGLILNWEDTEVYSVGKGEGSHNRGKVLGLVDVATMGVRNRPANQFTTDCIRGDHATLHPDPDFNEMWITCNSSFEIVVFDMDLKEVTARMPMPNGGSTHSGSFVRYEEDGMGDFFGEVLSDQNGLQGSALQIKRQLLQLTEEGNS